MGDMKVTSQPCIRNDFVENQDSAPAQQTPQTSETSEPSSTIQSQQISQSHKADMELSGKMKASELNAAEKTNAASQSNQSDGAKRVEAEMQKTRANGGSTRDVVVAGAKADAGSIHAGAYSISKGEDRMREVFKNSAGIQLEKNQKYDRTGQPILQLKDGKGPVSWCGVWGTDVWKRAGCDCKWGIGKPTDSKGKELPRVDTKGNSDPKLQNVKPGDMIVINSFDKETGKGKVGSTNHHALVTSVDYEVTGQSGKITCPPAEVPKDGKVVGFHTMNGNSPSAPDAQGNNPAIREGYVDLKKSDTYEEGGKNYEKKISSYYPMPPVKQ